MTEQMIEKGKGYTAKRFSQKAEWYIKVEENYSNPSLYWGMVPGWHVDEYISVDKEVVSQIKADKLKINDALKNILEKRRAAEEAQKQKELKEKEEEKKREAQRKQK